MRPVVRGDWPKDNTGNEVKYKNYENARGELIKRFGEYCSYCEMHLDTSLAVEHVRPKKPPGADNNIAGRKLNWNNFLLACTNCNSTKSNIDVELDDYFWPDRDNTFLVLQYSEGGLISSAEGLSDALKVKVKKTIKLTGLDKTPNVQKASDRRWLNRKESWEIAQRSKDRLASNNNTDFREQIVETAMANGFWSIWMTVFKADPEMLQLFIKAFPGTCNACFDKNCDYTPIRREGGQV